MVRGMEMLRTVEKYCAPILIGMTLLLFAWAIANAGGLSPIIQATPQLASSSTSSFWQAFVPALTADVGFWATLSLNMCDFTRYAKSQRSQIVGQAIGLPACMALFGFISLAITSATIVIYGVAITDPLELLARIEGVVPQILSLAGLIIATLTTNIAANVVSVHHLPFDLLVS